MEGNAKLYAKIAKVMAEVSAIEKTGRNDRFGYDFVESDALLNKLRPIMAKENLVIIPSIDATERYEVPGRDKPINITIARMRFVIADAETGESIEAVWSSEGMDGQDKGITKAATSGLKYFLLKLFLIGAGGDDPDRDSALTDKQTTTPTKPQAVRPTAAKTAPKKGAPASVQTPAWQAAITELADECGYYMKDDNPNTFRMVGAAGKLGYTEITDANIGEVVAALKKYAAEQSKEG